MRVEVRFDDGDYYVVTEAEVWEQARDDETPWRIESFLDRCVDITRDEDVEWRRLNDLKVAADRALYDYLAKMGVQRHEAEERDKRIKSWEDSIKKVGLPASVRQLHKPGSIKAY